MCPGYKAVTHNFDYVISIDAMGGKCEFAALQPKF
jgi:hypothetical protein